MSFVTPNARRLGIPMAVLIATVIYPSIVQAGIEDSAEPIFWSKAKQRGIVDHFFTLDATQKEVARRIGFEYKPSPGRAWKTMAPGRVPLHRFYHPKLHDHFMTTRPGNIAKLRNHPSWGWRDEGVIGYVYRQSRLGVVPLYRVWCGTGQLAARHHKYTTDPKLYNRWSANCKPEGVEGYVLPPALEGSRQFVDSWGCGAVGPHADDFANTVVSLSMSTGWSFKSMCNAMQDTHNRLRPGAVVVLFRDSSGLRHVSWYDPQLDTVNPNHNIYMGSNGLGSAKFVDLDHTRPNKQGVYPPISQWTFFNTQLQIDNWITNNGGNHLGGPTEPFGRWLTAMQLSEFTARPFCVPNAPQYFCQTAMNGKMIDPDGAHRIEVSLIRQPNNSNGNGLRLLLTREKVQNDTLNNIIFQVINAVAIAAVSYGIGSAVTGYIGTLVALSSPVSSAITAGIGTFVNGLISGDNPLDAFIRALPAAGLAFVGRLILLAGDSAALVGVEGGPCPTGDQCFVMKLLNNTPLVKALAELHDPFIVISEKAAPVLKRFASVGSWFKAITIPPFFVPACAALTSCVTGGAIIAREFEVGGP